MACPLRDSAGTSLLQITVFALDQCHGRGCTVSDESCKVLYTLSTDKLASWDTPLIVALVFRSSADSSARLFVRYGWNICLEALSFSFSQHLFNAPFRACFLLQVNRLGLPVTEAEARLLVVEYGGAAGGGGGDGQLSLDDFDFMVRRQSRVSLSGP